METIRDALDRFLEERGGALEHADDVVELLLRSLDAYAHQWLPDRERTEWEASWPAEDEPVPLTASFGPELIPGNLAEFLGYFMIRKVSVDGALLEASGRVTVALLDWLVEQGVVSASEVADVRGLALAAVTTLPRAAGLCAALDRLTRDPDHGPVLEERELLFGAVITRVEPAALWFSEPDADEDVGPVDVPPDLARLADEEWGVGGLVLERTPAGWRVAESGTVYPF